MEKTRLEKKIEKWIIMKIVKYFKLSSKTEKRLKKWARASRYNHSHNNNDEFIYDPAYKSLPCNIYHEL
ncbi:hypothetical protein CQA38_05000 [Campylobacter sp. MIT 12-5580]|uniref:hypothetical protein n=1 Tax=Campylobacter sp. MIT 12-5580 TaxID=2040651 RepID=UPI0010F87533|nr:hypothetical protein [Campylobacter sp. MIT 12-5580]TKX29439.1 hypothetical protein CQA38_05000 [Campylobacter sp. MIT 12-5580]